MDKNFVLESKQVFGEGDRVELYFIRDTPPRCSIQLVLRPEEVPAAFVVGGSYELGQILVK